MQEPMQTHWQVLHIMHYLKDVLAKGLFYKMTKHIRIESTLMLTMLEHL